MKKGDKQKCSSQVNSSSEAGNSGKKAPVRKVMTSQVTKVKHLEDKIHELLRKVPKCNSVREVNKCTFGGVEKKIGKKTKRTEKLTEATNAINDSVTSVLESAVAVTAEEDIERVAEKAVETRGGEAPELWNKRVNHKPHYKPLQTGDLQEFNYSKFFLVKFSEQAKRQVNPYASISKIQNRRNYRQSCQVCNWQ